MAQNIIIGFWILCSVYCLYKLYQRSKMSSMGGIIGYSPGLEVIMVIALGPILAIVDISLTWIRLYKEAEEAKRRAQEKGV
jgi:hypothetical protein